jgi:hypothetical protein
MLRRSPALRRLACALAPTASAALAGCGPTVECQAPLTTTDCTEAVRQAQAALEEHPDWIPDAGRLPRLALVWDACQDADCAEDLDGVAFVRVMDAHNEPIGRVIVCIEDELCGDQEVLFGFP